MPLAVSSLISPWRGTVVQALPTVTLLWFPPSVQMASRLLSLAMLFVRRLRLAVKRLPEQCRKMEADNDANNGYEQAYDAANPPPRVKIVGIQGVGQKYNT